MSAPRRALALVLAALMLAAGLAPAALAATVLEVGSSGSDVTAVQRFLAEAGNAYGIGEKVVASAES